MFASFEYLTPAKRIHGNFSSEILEFNTRDDVHWLFELLKSLSFVINKKENTEKNYGISSFSQY